MRFPCFIELRRGFLFPFSFFACHALAALGVLGTPWPWPARLALVGVTAGLAWFAWRRVITWPTALLLEADGGLAIANAGQMQPVELLPGSLALPGLCVLRWRAREAGRETRVLVLLADAAAPEALRRLRLWLRCCVRSDVPGN
ncbi:MAG: hypothetical protein N3C59_01150 [Azovibrio sp.]|nr:hypothetical protein [Azovibrio sp.]